MVALWIITVHLEKAKVVRYNEAYYYLKHKYETISATLKAFYYAVTNQKNEKYFRKTGDVYFLSPEGQKIVEGWIVGKPLNFSDDTENNVEE